MSELPAEIRARCVYCLDTATLHDEQIAVRGAYCYLCTPLGQLVEGYLAIAPLRCVGALSLLGPSDLRELASFKTLVRSFYRQQYGAGGAIFYEQGRGGAGSHVDRLGNFPHHAHLCSLPIAFDLHGLLEALFRSLTVDGIEAVPRATAGQPYIYAEAGGRAAVYLARTPEQQRALEVFRLKPLLARALGVPSRGDWRNEPGHAELARLRDALQRYLREHPKQATADPTVCE